MSFAGAITLKVVSPAPRGTTEPDWNKMFGSEIENGCTHNSLFLLGESTILTPTNPEML